MPGAWSWTGDPLVLLGLAALGGGYYAVVGPLRARHGWGDPATPRQVAAFAGGLVLLALTLLSPLDALGRTTLFSAHMLQIMLLNTAVAPLLLLGLPTWLVVQRLGWLVRLGEGGTLVFWAAAALLFNGTFLLWHVASLYEPALHVGVVHDLASVTLLLTGALRWWPLVTPGSPPTRLAHPGQMLYLLLESLPLDIFAVFLIFAARPAYATYRLAAHPWGLTALLDQQIAGCIALLPGTFLDIVLVSVIFFAWFRQMEREQQAEDERRAALQQG
jgi:cytochrome c oxidase assembly factor CtaG